MTYANWHLENGRDNTFPMKFLQEMRTWFLFGGLIPLEYAPPGGETVAQLRDRCVRALERWQTQYPEANVVWVTHGGLIGVLLCHVLDIA